MPNWCNNNLHINGPLHTLLNFKDCARGKQPEYAPGGPESPNNFLIEELSFHSFVPVPQEILDAGYGRAGIDWESVNWGVKWGACETKVIFHQKQPLIYQFDTPWGPPIKWLDKVSSMYKDLTFSLDWFEDYNFGIVEFSRRDGGRNYSFEFKNYKDATADQEYILDSLVDDLSKSFKFRKIVNSFNRKFMVTDQLSIILMFVSEDKIILSTGNSLKIDSHVEFDIKNPKCFEQVVNYINDVFYT